MRAASLARGGELVGVVAVVERGPPLAAVQETLGPFSGHINTRGRRRRDPRFQEMQRP